MHAIDIYKWIGVSGNSFKKQYQGQDALYNQAKNFWNTLDSNAWIPIAIFLFLGILLAGYYYTSYNNQPHRHYQPKHWGIWLAITAVASLFLTLLTLVILASPRLDGAIMLEIKISIVNALYAAIIYLITSVVWCNWFPTNAYRLFNIKK